jgi:hypothetical protein
MLSRASHSAVAREFWREALVLLLLRRLRRLEVFEPLVLDWVERDIFGLRKAVSSSSYILVRVAHCDGSGL